MILKERIEFENRRPAEGLPKTLAAPAAGCDGGWVLVLAPIAVAAALIVPVPVSGLAQLQAAWLEAKNLNVLLAIGVLTFGAWAFRRRFWPRDLRESRSLRNALLLVAPQAVLLRAAIDLGPATGALTWNWWARDAWLWMPWFLIPAFAVTSLGPRYGVLTALTGALLLYLRADPGPLPLAGCLVSAIAGVALLRRCPTRTRVLRAGAGAGFVLAAIGGAQRMMAEAPLEAIAGAALIPVAVGLSSAFAVLAFMPMIEWVLGEVSDVSLVEFGNDHPLLDQLRERAPGTWHHTLNVADLAEKAAVAIGARALFCKTAALYHDVGKLKEPAIFAENIHGPSPHENLDPRVSARRIIEHVTHGLELARKHRLPSSFRAIIAEHHGVSVVRCFFAKACEQLGEGEDPNQVRASFCYPGPRPSSRESGIIALADIVEAATRSTILRSEAETRAFVSKLIADRVSEGELGQCPMTLADLAKVEDAFVRWLKGRNHYRPPYPDGTRLAVG